MVSTNTIKLIYGRSHTVGSLLIRIATFSRWSHVGIVTPDGKHVIESISKKGVVLTDIREFKSRYSTTEISNAPIANSKNNFYKLAMEQLGKKYDWFAIAGFIFCRRWDTKDKWICSELYAYCSNIVRHDRVSRFTPEDCWKISKSLE